MRFKCVTKKIIDYGKGFKTAEVDVLGYGQLTSHDDANNQPIDLTTASISFFNDAAQDDFFQEGQSFCIDLTPDHV